MKLSLLSLPRLLLTALGLALAPQAVLAQSNLPNAQVGVAYTFQVTTSPPAASGSVYGATGLPPGLAINSSSGVISGTPTTAGVYENGNVTVTSGSTTNAYAVRITVSGATGTPGITSLGTVSGTVGTAFSYTVTASPAATSFNIGPLPAGLVGNATTGLINGTPTAAGTFDVALSGNNSSGTGAATTLRVTIVPPASAPVVSGAATASSTGTGPGFTVSLQLSATNTPTSFTASGLPQGVTINAAGLVSGTTTLTGTFPVTVTAANASGTSAPFNLTLTVGAVPVVSSTTASGTVGSALTIALQATPAATSFNLNAATLPAGLTFNSTTNTISGTPTAAGVTSVALSANNAVGTGPAATLVITIATPPPVGGGGGSGGSGGSGGGGGTTTVTPPVIATQPAGQSITEGASVTFGVSATGTGLNFQWSKNGTIISGAQSATLTLTNVSSNDAGNYTVYVSNTGGAVTSASAVLAVTARVDAPTLTTQPIAQSITAGGSATFGVATAGTAPLTYQWQKDGANIGGATNATLTLANAAAASAGSYRVVVTNSAGSVTSNAVTLSVSARAIMGTYFGTFGNNGGSFALIVRDNRTGVFLGFASAARLALVSRDVVVDANGRFSVAVADPRPGTAAASATPATAAHAADIHIDGLIAADGTVSGTVPALNLTFSAPVAVTTGATASTAGFYEAGANGSSAQSYAIVSPAGQALVVNVTGVTADGGTGTVATNGAINVMTAASATITGSVAADTSILTTTVTPVTGAATRFVGANNDVRADTEKLVNISTRSQTGTAGNSLIAGFYIKGTAPKPVLIRAIGPTLGTAFNVGGSLSAARVEIFRGATSLAVGNDWGAGPNAAAITATSVRVGAFALPNNSRDAALLLSLEPGAYTAVVTGQGGASGVSLVEVYDATAGAIPRDQRIINIATRATAGAGDTALIAGFYVAGSVPKRVLLRGAGPSLAQFGVEGVLARPQLTINSGNTVLATNAGWSTSADAAAIASGAAQVGAFAFGATSQDAAIILHLAPGAYTAQVSGVGNTTGVALVEVYELP